MKTKNILIVIVFFVSVTHIKAQLKINKKSIGVYTKIAPEKIYINQNTDVLFSGEKLFFKLFCLNNDFSAGISKIVYVELIDFNRNTVFKQKIRLKDAVAYGDFKAPYNLSSGNYKLIAYTQWMRNGGNQNYSSSDVYLVNPFSNEQSNFIKVNKPYNKPVIKETNNDLLELVLNQKVYSKREKVSLSINTIKNDLSFGNYSVSVKRKEQLSSQTINNKVFKKPILNNSYNFKNVNNEYYWVYPPEHNGELITGKVLNIKNNKPVKDIRVALSIPSETFVFNIVKTNKLGEFFFDLEKNYLGNNAIIQIEDSRKEKYKITINPPASFDYSNLKFGKVQLSENDLITIKRISKNTQIENAYIEVKQDSIITILPEVTFYKPDYTYVLDDFKRFPSVKETMVEIVEHSWVTTKKENTYFSVRDYKSKGKEDASPLILIDGILIQNHNDLNDYDVKNIHAINIITDKFLFHKKTYGGVISVFTKDLNFTPITKGAFLKNLNLNKPVLDKIYFKQEYLENNKRVPDFRSQLLWQPKLVLNSTKKELSFYTSDNTGEYEIIVEGYTFKGEKVKVKQLFKVL